MTALAPPSGDAEAAPHGKLELTTRAEADGQGLALTKRWLVAGDWGRAVARAAWTRDHGAPEPPEVTVGLTTPRGVIGPVTVAGAWRELSDPLGFSAGSAVFAEPTGLRLDAGLDPGRRRGLQLTPIAGVAVAAFADELGGPGRAQSPLVAGLVAAWSAPALADGEVYAALRSPAPPAVAQSWRLAAVPFPGGPLYLAGARVALGAAGPVSLRVSGNLSAGAPRGASPARAYLHGAHVRVAARAELGPAELAAMVAAAHRGFFGLAGTSPSAPLVWGARLRGTAAPSWGRATYGVSVRGEELAAAPLPPVPEPRRSAVLSLAQEVPWGPWSLRAATRLELDGAQPAQPELTLRAELDGPHLGLGATWRDVTGRGELQFVGQVKVASLALKATVTTAGAHITAALEAAARRPGFRFRLRLAELALSTADSRPAPPPQATVTVTVEL